LKEALVAAIFCWFAVVLVLTCAVLHFMRRRQLACWLHVIFPAALTLALSLDLAHGTAKLGQASYNSDMRTLSYLLGFLVVTVLAALRPKWGRLFWIAWAFSAFVCAVVIFLTYFWRLFS
jgi:uncharacterized membrane protein